MYAYLLAYHLRFHDLADDQYDQVHYYGCNTHPDITCDERVHRPWYQDASGTQHRQSIDYGDQERKEQGVLGSDDGETYKSSINVMAIMMSAALR